MNKETSEYTPKGLFSLWSNVLKIYGAWPLSEDTLFLKGRIVFAILQLIVTTTAAFMELCLQHTNFDYVIDAVVTIVISTLVNAKLCLMYLHRDELAYVVNAAVKDWNMTKNQKYKKMMIKRANFSNIVTKIFYITGMFPLSLYIIKIFVFDKNYVIDNNFENGSFIFQPPYIIPGGCIFNNMGSLIYYLILINQTIQLSIMCPINFGGDAFYIAITAHLCEQCEIFKFELMKFGEENDRLKTLIVRHQHLMMLASKLEIVYSGIIFMQMFMSVVLISITGFGFLWSLNHGDIIGVTKCFSAMQFMLLQSYLYTFPADELKDQGEGLLRSFYSSQWCNMPVSRMKDMVIIMMRMNIPPYYTAGKFFNMTRESYMAVIKTAMSYLSVLRVMME